MRESLARGEKVVFRWVLLVVIAFTWAAAATGWAVYEIKTEPKVEMVFALIDEETRVLATSKAKNWTPDDQAHADIARRWIQNLRSRTVDEAIVKFMRSDMRRITSDSAVGPAAVMLKEMDAKLDDLGGLGLQVMDGVETTILGWEREAPPCRAGEGNEYPCVAVRVDWKERTYARPNKDGTGEVGPWTSWYTNVLVRRRDPVDTAEAEKNGTRLYVVAFSPLGQGRSPPAGIPIPVAQR